MANTLRIKRRVTGAAGAPSTLANGELSYNEVDDTLYYGKGLGTGIAAAVVIAIAGAGFSGNFVTLNSTQTLTGDKTFTGALLAATATMVTVPTATAIDNSTKAANTAWVRGYAQASNVTLSNIAALAGSGFLVANTTAGTAAFRSIAGTAGRIIVTDGSGATGSPTIDLSTTGIAAGTYTKVAYDVYGRAVTASSLTTGDITTALGFTPENIANRNVVNGYAGLDATGKILIAQIPSSLLGGLNYQGVWNASTNTPALVSATGTKGYYYKVSVAGSTTLDGNSNWTVGDLVTYNGTGWDKVEGGTSDVVSVAGKVGVVLLTNTDISGLGTLSTQMASAVAITGGTISGVAITGGSVAGASIVGNITGNAANVTGIVATVNGGTGVAGTLTGYVRAAGLAAMTASTTIPNTDITGLGTMSTQMAAAVAITGGSITGTSFTGNITGNAVNVTGIVAVANGGTGATTLTGYVKGTGTTAFTSTTTIPNTDITGLGTMSTQNAAAVAITGGTIDNVTFDGGVF